MRSHWTELLIQIPLMLAMLGVGILLFRKDRRETWLILAGTIWTGMISILSWSGFHAKLLHMALRSNPHDPWSPAIFAFSTYSSLGVILFVVGFLLHSIRRRATHHRLMELKAIASEFEAPR